MSYLKSDNCKISDRCLIAAHMFGDKFAIDFWKVASFYLNKMKREKWKHVKTSSSDSRGEPRVLHKYMPHEYMPHR